MGFAIRNDGLGWRAIDGEAHVMEGEYYAKEPPSPMMVPAVPQEVTRFQSLAALHIAGLLEQVEAIMSNPETSVLTKLAWQNAQTFKRYSPMVQAIAAVLVLSEQQLDELFISASQIE